MSTLERGRVAELDLRKLWYFGAVAICIFFIFTTAIRPLSPAALRFFDLDKEGNLATLWSGMLLLLVALHAFDGWISRRAGDPVLARAWLVLALIMAGLSFDEVGEVHERMPGIGGHSNWLTLLPFGLVLMAMLLYVLQAFYRTPGQRRTFWLIVIGFALIATVPVQVLIESSHEWPGYLRRLRTTVEEGVELVAMLVLLKAALPNTKGVLGDVLGGERLDPFPVFEAVQRLRLPIVIGGFAGALVLAAISPHLTSSHLNSQGGQPTAWLAGSLYVMGLLAVLRPSLMTGERPHFSAVALVGVASLACVAAMLDASSQLSLALLSVVALLTLVLWLLDPRQSLRGYLPAAVFFAVVLAITWARPGSLFIDYCADPLIALGFFYGCTARREDPAA